MELIYHLIEPWHVKEFFCEDVKLHIMIRIFKKRRHKSNGFGRVNVFHLGRLRRDSKVLKHLQHLHLRRPPCRLLTSFHTSRRRRCAASVESGPLPPRWQPLISLNVSTSACGRKKRHQLEGAAQWGRSSSGRHVEIRISTDNPSLDCPWRVVIM